MSSAKPSKHKISALLKLFIKSNQNIKQFASENGMPENTARRWLIDYAKFYGLKPAPPVESGKEKLRMFHLESLPKSATYIVTSAQSATPVNKKFLASLKQYLEAHKATFLVIPIRYKNPTSLFPDKADDWWDASIIPYLCNTRFDLCPNLTLMADIKTQPTAVDPLTRLTSMSRGKSCIVGHPKVSLKTVPVTRNSLPKILVSTGSITEPNYTDSSAGKTGEFHHSFSAVVVEIDGDMFHVRHISACPDGSFIDLDTEYTPSGYHQAPPAEALVMGDTHVQFVDKSVMEATLGSRDCLAKRINAKHFVWHDVLDFYSANHHHRKKPFIGVAKYRAGLHVVAKEVKEAFAMLCGYAKKYPGVKHVFPESNHSAAFGRWINECDWREDPANAEFYLRTALYMVENTKMGPSGSQTPDPFTYWGTELTRGLGGFKFLNPGESFVIKGIDVGHHGHIGPNGSRGSLKAISRIGLKTIIGHSHSPGIFEGGYQVGTSSNLSLEYNSGPSSWLQTHAIIYANGKRTLINIINGKFTIRKIKRFPVRGAV